MKWKNQTTMLSLLLKSCIIQNVNKLVCHTFSELVHSETAVSKLQLLASCSWQFKVLVLWQNCAGSRAGDAEHWGTLELHKPDIGSFSTNSLMTATSIPSASSCSVNEIHTLPTYRVCWPLLLCGGSSPSPQTPPKSLPTNRPLIQSCPLFSTLNSSYQMHPPDPAETFLVHVK